MRLERLFACASLASIFAAGACDSTVNLGNGPDGSVPPAGDASGGGTEAGLDAAAEAAGVDGNVPFDAGSDTAPPVDAADASGPRAIFVTRGTYTADFGGLDGGDFRCQSSADAIPLGGKWRAWLSDSAHDAAGRFTSNGPWIAVGSGVTLFPTRDSLRGYPLAAIQTDELGKAAGQMWWTGTLINGVRAADTCNDWSTKGQSIGGMSGSRRTTGVPGKEWTEDTVFSCESALALLCLQD